MINGGHTNQLTINAANNAVSNGTSYRPLHAQRISPISARKVQTFHIQLADVFFSSRVRLPFLRIIRSTWELPCEL
jgi:hypothetical protein